LTGWASKFIFPPHDFVIADSLITNFHEPESVLLMQTAAFGGHDLIMHAYNEAVKEKYRLLLLWRCHVDFRLMLVGAPLLLHSTVNTIKYAVSCYCLLEWFFKATRFGFKAG
jgi:hypothetical protein